MVNTVTEKQMRAQDIIRAVLDVLDTQEENITVDVDSVVPNQANRTADSNRYSIC